MWRGMTRPEIEEFWCSAASPVQRVYFDDCSGFASFIVLMDDGTITAQIEGPGKTQLAVLVEALAYFAS